jgi:hypothetical protein
MSTTAGNNNDTDGIYYFIAFIMVYMAISWIISWLANV